MTRRRRPSPTIHDELETVAMNRRLQLLCDELEALTQALRVLDARLDYATALFAGRQLQEGTDA